jgi:hypothetical protein
MSKLAMFAVLFLIFVFSFGAVGIIALMVTWLLPVWALVMSTVFIVVMILCIGILADER